MIFVLCVFLLSAVDVFLTSTAHSQCHTYSCSCGSICICALDSSSVRDMAEEEVPATQPEAENHDAEDSQQPGDAFPAPTSPVPEVPEVPDQENEDGPDVHMKMPASKSAEKSAKGKAKAIAKVKAVARAKAKAKAKAKALAKALAKSVASPSKMKRPAASLAASALKNGGQDDAEPEKKKKVVEGRLIPRNLKP